MVELEERRAPLWLLPGREQPLPAVRTERFGLGVVVGVTALVAAVPAYLFFAPPSVWEPESLLVALMLFSFVSYGAAVEVRGAATLDASFIASLVAVVFLGPLPAAVIFALPEINGWFERGRVVSLLGNTASAFWGALAAAWTLEALSGGVPLDPVLADLPAVAITGAVLLGAGYLVSALIVCVVWEGHSLRPLVEQEVAELAPASMPMVVGGTIVVLLYEEFGLVGLVPLALLLLLPRIVVPRLAQSRDPARLDRTAAIALYARAIAQGLDLDATQKRVLLDAVTHLGDAKRLTRIEDFDRVMQTVLYCRERWDGAGGFPGVLSGEAIPVESRVLAVAERLGSMTAAGDAQPHTSTGDRRAGADRPAWSSTRAWCRRPAGRSRRTASCRRDLRPSRCRLRPRAGVLYQPVESAPHKTRQKRNEFGPFRLRVLRPPRSERLGATGDDLGELLELGALEARALCARVECKQVGQARRSRVCAAHADSRASSGSLTFNVSTVQALPGSATNDRNASKPRCSRSSTGEPGAMAGPRRSSKMSALRSTAAR